MKAPSLALLLSLPLSLPIALALAPPAIAAGPTATSVTVRFLLPHSPESPGQENELAGIVEEYNRGPGAAENPPARVELIRRGEGFSSLKELVASFLAGDVPELAAIETSELPAIEKMKLAHPLPAGLLGGKSRRAGDAPRSVPFRLTVPILLADQEMLFRAHANPDRLPRTWPELVRLVDTLAASPGGDTAPAADRTSLALPLQGARGLWLFEAIAGKPLWRREPGGIRANRALASEIGALQKLIDQPAHLGADETWEKGLQAFLDRKAPLLIASLDILPYVAKQASFRWTAAPVPRIGGGLAELEGGSALVMPRESAPAARFVEYLYSPAIAPRWLVAGGYLPLRPEWLSLPGWKSASAKLPAYGALAAKLQPKVHRTTDPDVVRAHSEWIRALRLIFTQASQRPSLETVLTQLDSQMSAKSSY